MADCKKYNGSTWQHSLRKLTTSTDTITTLPTVIYPNNTTATVGLKGNTVQNGTPTPQNPVMPNGTGERTGNLFDSNTIEVGGLNVTTGAEIPDSSRRRSGYIAVDSSTYYGISRELDGTLSSNFWILGYDENKNSITDGSQSSRPCVVSSIDGSTSNLIFQTTPTTKYIRWYVTANNSYSNIMLNVGNTNLPYEPYGYKLDISSASTTTPVYLGEIESTRRIRKLVLTGEEDITVSGAYYNVRTGTQKPISRNGLISTHFIAATGTISIGTCRFGGTEANPNDVLIVNYDNGSGGLDNFKSYLSTQSAAGTPVTVWYVLATPETGIVNEPLRKIGTYADTLNNVSIPVTAGGDTLSVETTVLPSEVTVGYNGWHPTIVHERANGAWT